MSGHGLKRTLRDQEPAPGRATKPREMDQPLVHNMTKSSPPPGRLSTYSVATAVQQPMSPTIGSRSSVAAPIDGHNKEDGADLEKRSSGGRFSLHKHKSGGSGGGGGAGSAAVVAGQPGHHHHHPHIRLMGHHRKRFSDLSKSEKARLRFKNHALAMTGEYVGTLLFTFFAFGGTQVALVPQTSITGATATANSGGSAEAAETIQAPNTSSLQFVALSFGFSLTVTAWTFYRVSGGLFNPAVSLGLALVGVITPVRAILLTIVQCLGAITGAALIQAIIPGPLYVTTRLAANMSPIRGMFLEMFLTIMLMLTILLLAAEKSRATFLAPIGIGLALFVTQLVGVYYTGASVNPARSLGPDVVIRSFPTYHWIYWVGPFLGTLIACGFYKMIKLLHYETVVPGQEDDGMNPGLGGSAPKDDKAMGSMDHGMGGTQGMAGMEDMEAGYSDKPSAQQGAPIQGQQPVTVVIPASSLAQLGADGRRSSIINLPGAGSIALDGIAGPGLSDYSAPGMKGNLGADLSSATAHTKYQGRDVNPHGENPY